MVCFGEKFPNTKITGAVEPPLFPSALLFSAIVHPRSHTFSEELLIVKEFLGQESCQSNPQLFSSSPKADYDVSELAGLCRIDKPTLNLCEFEQRRGKYSSGFGSYDCWSKSHVTE